MFYTTTQILPRKGEKKRKRSCIIVYNLIAKGVPKKKGKHHMYVAISWFLMYIYCFFRIMLANTCFSSEHVQS